MGESNVERYLKSIEDSSSIEGSAAHDDRIKFDGSRPERMDVVEMKGVSDFTVEVICDCLGNGLFIGGVGGAPLRANGSLNGIDLVVGVPYDEDEEA